MLDFRETTTREILRKLAIDGKMISIDELDEIHPTERSVEPTEKKGFAIISANSNSEINSILEGFPDLDPKLVEIYKLR